MKIAVPKEILADEPRVSVVPSMVSVLTKANHQVLIESGAGSGASFPDDAYEKNGGTIVKDVQELFKAADILLKFQAPGANKKTRKHEIEMLREGSAIISSLPPLSHPDLVPKLRERKITQFAMEYLPRITKAQSMDVLSSMATCAGYKAVLIAANHLGKFYPLLMTAAGTIPPATVLILGAGVAGLQAIATAKRLGAKVEAFDPRPVVKEQVESLGASFIAMEMPDDAETKGGYAKALPDEFLRKEQEAIAARLPKIDALITTAQIFGQQAPLLVTEEMIKLMPAGSVIVDLAAAEGGNTALTGADRVVEKHGVTIFGEVNLARKLPIHASQMHSKNVITLFRHIYSDDTEGIDLEDEIVKGVCITHNGEIINEMVKKNFDKESAS